MNRPTEIPTGMPSLSRGKHRSARTGACFMEFASYLAGEPWSDHPQCTDPLLSFLARAVNDAMRDGRRDEIARDIPRVIGLRGDHRQIAPVVALRAAVTAIRVASMGRQNALAVSLLTVVDLLPATAPAALRDEVAAALADVPAAEEWARDHLRRHPAREKDVRRHGPATAVQLAVTGIAEACDPDPDALLAAALRGAIDDVEEMLTAPEVDEVTPVARLPLTV